MGKALLIKWFVRRATPSTMTSLRDTIRTTEEQELEAVAVLHNSLACLQTMPCISRSCVLSGHALCFSFVRVAKP